MVQPLEPQQITDPRILNYIKNNSTGDISNESIEPQEITDPRILASANSDIPSSTVNPTFMEPHTGKGGILFDTLQSLYTTPGALAEGAVKIPGIVKGAYQYGEQNPGGLSVLGNLGMSVPESAATLANIPSNIASWLLKKGYNPTIPLGPFSVSANNIKNVHIPIQKWESDLGVAPSSQGAQDVRDIGSVFTGGAEIKGLSLLGKMITGGLYNVGAGGNFIHGAAGTALGNVVSKLGNIGGGDVTTSGNKVLLKELLKSSKTSPNDTVPPGPSGPSGSSGTAGIPGIDTSDINQLKTISLGTGLAAENAKNILTTRQKLENLQGNINALPISRVNPSLEQVFKGQTQPQREYNSQNMVDESQKDLNDTLQTIPAISSEVAPYQTPEKHAGGIVAQKEQDIMDSYKPIYNDINNRASQIAVKPPISPNVDMDAITLKNITDALGPKYMTDNPGIAQALSEGRATISGDKFISLMRAATNAHNFYNIRANNKMLDDPIRQAAAKKAEQLKPIMDAYKNTFEGTTPNEQTSSDQPLLPNGTTPKKIFPDDIVNDYYNTQKSYSENVMPFRDWEGDKNLQEKGEIPKDFFASIAGSKPEQKIMQRLVMNNPEVLHEALSHHFRDNPEKILEKNPATEPFIQASPQFSDAREVAKSAQSNLDIAKSIQKNVKKSAPRQRVIDKYNEAKQELADLESKQHQMTAEDYKNKRNKIINGLWGFVKKMGGGQLWDIVKIGLGDIIGDKLK